MRVYIKASKHKFNFFIMKIVIFAALLYNHVTAITSSNAELIEAGSFHGSDALLDGYCDDKQTFIRAFTLPHKRLTVTGSVDDITRNLSVVNHTGMYMIAVVIYYTCRCTGAI